jgi:hypothetical protein
MPSTSRILALALAGYALPALLVSAHAQDNPACSLLTLDEIRSASGQDYDDASPGDELGQGIGGGASCQWGGPSFVPGKGTPMLSLVVIPNKNGSYTANALKRTPQKGCTREKLTDVGEAAFLETCEKSRGPVAYANAGKWDLVVQIDAEPPATAASVKAPITAVAKAAVVKLRAKA